MIGDAWYKSAKPAFGLSGFKATGIYPYDPNAVPEIFFTITDASVIDCDDISSQFRIMTFLCRVLPHLL